MIETIENLLITEPLIILIPIILLLFGILFYLAITSSLILSKLNRNSENIATINSLLLSVPVTTEQMGSEQIADELADLKSSVNLLSRLINEVNTTDSGQVQDIKQPISCAQNSNINNTNLEVGYVDEITVGVTFDPVLDNRSNGQDIRLFKICKLSKVLFSFELTDYGKNKKLMKVLIDHKHLFDNNIPSTENISDLKQVCGSFTCKEGVIESIDKKIKLNKN